jgi:hypothetical protein
LDALGLRGCEEVGAVNSGALGWVLEIRWCVYAGGGGAFDVARREALQDFTYVSGHGEGDGVCVVIECDGKTQILRAKFVDGNIEEQLECSDEVLEAFGGGVFDSEVINDEAEVCTI